MQDLEFRQLIERLKLRSPIEVIVGERVAELKKKGALYQARCPFHEERTPSFTVDPRRGTWRCWGACSEGGDVISFLERFDGLSFLDAVRLLAQSSGEELPENFLRKRSHEADARAEDRYDVLRRADELYQRALDSDAGRPALDYLVGRGLARETLALFGVGWAPRQGSPLLAAAVRSGVAEELLLETGLIKRSDDGRAYDFFRGRLTVPIRDRLGRTVGFGARLLPLDSERLEREGRAVAKYVNTAETTLFHKGRLIYGLDLAADRVRTSKHLILVEGYTDVMAAHQAGHSNVVAVLGTSTTDDHAALVRRTGARRVTLVFDGDTAGRKASARALAGLMPLGLELNVAELALGIDPCDLFVSEDGGARFQALLDSALDWFAWSLAELEGLGGAPLAARVDELFELLVRLPQAVERSFRVGELARAIGLPEADVRMQWSAFNDRRRPRMRAESRQPEPQSEPELPVDPALDQAFAALIGALLCDNSLIPMYSELEPQCPAGDLAVVFRTLLQLYDESDVDEEIHAGTVLTALADHPARARVEPLVESASRAESPQILARDQELWLERRRHELELRELKRTLAQSNPSVGDDSVQRHDVLKNIHEELRRRSVSPHPAAEPSLASQRPEPHV